MNQLIQKKQDFLAETLKRCLQDPALSIKEITEVIVFVIGSDLEKFLKEYKKEVKKEYKV